MKNVIILLAMAFLSLNLMAVEEERTLSPFTSIDNSCSLDMIIKQGDVQKVVVVSPEKYLGKIVTEVNGNTLNIDVKGSLTYRNEDLHIEITVKDLKEITNSGSADIEFLGIYGGDHMLISMHGSGDLEGDFNVKDMEIKMHGSGDVEISGVNSSLDVRQMGSGDFDGKGLHLGSAYFSINGSGDAEVSGTAAMMELSQSGSGDFDGRSFEVKTAKIRKTSSGEADVHVTDTLDARLSGSGDLNVKGRPDMTHFSVNGSGEIHTL